MSDTLLRTFICFCLPDVVKASLTSLIQEGKARGQNLRWSNVENAHLTLRFLGDTTSDQIAQIREALSVLVRGQPPIELCMDRVGAFPSFKRPRVFWAGFSRSNPALQKMAAAVGAMLEPVGFEKEKRPFRPHLTLARVRGAVPEGTIRAWQQMQPPPVTFTIEELVFMQSDLTPRGALYTPIQTYKFQLNRQG